MTFHYVIYVKFRIVNLPQSPYIGQNSDGCIANLWISNQSLINEKCHNPRTSDDIDMKLGSVPKVDKTTTVNSTKYDDGIMYANSEVILDFLIHG